MNAPRPYTRRGLCEDQRDTITSQVMGDASVVSDTWQRSDGGMVRQCALAGGDYEVQTRWE